jgi:Rieske Fe-S protein
VSWWFVCVHDARVDGVALYFSYMDVEKLCATTHNAVTFEIDDIMIQKYTTSTYDHRRLRTELPVRSAELKQSTGGLVVRWVTTGEYPLLYVFCSFCLHTGSIMNSKREGCIESKLGLVFADGGTRWRSVWPARSSLVIALQ